MSNRSGVGWRSVGRTTKRSVSVVARVLLAFAVTSNPFSSVRHSRRAVSCSFSRLPPPTFSVSLALRALRERESQSVASVGTEASLTPCPFSLSLFLSLSIHLFLSFFSSFFYVLSLPFRSLLSINSSLSPFLFSFFLAMRRASDGTRSLSIHIRRILRLFSILFVGSSRFPSRAIFPPNCNKSNDPA